MSSPIEFQHFSLVSNQGQAIATLSALSCFGNSKEKQFFKPEILKLKRQCLIEKHSFCLVQTVNDLIARYLRQCGELSDQLIIFISKSIQP